MPSMQSLLAHLPKQTEGRLVLVSTLGQVARGTGCKCSPGAGDPLCPRSCAGLPSLLLATQLQDPILVGTWNGIRGQLARGQHDVSEVQ